MNAGKSATRSPSSDSSVHGSDDEEKRFVDAIVVMASGGAKR